MPHHIEINRNSKCLFFFVVAKEILCTGVITIGETRGSQMQNARNFVSSLQLYPLEQLTLNKFKSVKIRWHFNSNDGMHDDHATAPFSSITEFRIQVLMHFLHSFHCLGIVKFSFRLKALMRKAQIQSG